MTKPVDFLDDFVNEIRETLKFGEERWGDTWLNRTKKGQEQRIRQYFDDMFDRLEYAGHPIRWSALAGEALIGWIREEHPELFPDGEVEDVN